MKMCGRYQGLSEEDFEEIHNIVSEVSKKYNTSEVVRGEVFPTNQVPVIYSHEGKNILSSAKWGFPNLKNSGVIINARGESLAEKPMFRKPFARQRCLVPAKGYYEWLTGEDRKKTKYAVRLRGKSIIYMAGLYNIFVNGTGSQYAAITIVTTAAHPQISFIHDRMPVILPEGSINRWLKNDEDLVQLQEMLLPYPGEMVYEMV